MQSDEKFKSYSFIMSFCLFVLETDSNFVALAVPELTEIRWLLPPKCWHFTYLPTDLPTYLSKKTGSYT